jgi:hypothetical protein
MVLRHNPDLDIRKGSQIGLNELTDSLKIMLLLKCQVLHTNNNFALIVSSD